MYIHFLSFKYFNISVFQHQDSTAKLQLMWFLIIDFVQIMIIVLLICFANLFD